MKNPQKLPKVSIITPSLNQAEFLEQTIDSVLSQNYPNIEYIIMDGGSSDNSLEIINKYKKHLYYWESKKDNGQSDAIDRGIQIATGKIVGWLNSDDCYLTGCISALVQSFSKNPNAGLVFGQVEVINEKNQHVGYFKKPIPEFTKILCLDSIIPQQASIFSKDKYLKVGGLNSTLHFALDHDLFLRIASIAPIIQVNKVLAQYRISKGNKGATNRSAWAPEFVTIIDCLIEKNNLKLSNELIKTAYSKAYYLGGCEYLDDAQYLRARQSFIKATTYSKKASANFAFARNYLRTFLGKRGNDIYIKCKVLLFRSGLFKRESDWWTSIKILENQSSQEELKRR
jgi:glycosyltransferase involved in cell wall biosynthesis